MRARFLIMLIIIPQYPPLFMVLNDIYFLQEAELSVFKISLASTPYSFPARSANNKEEVEENEDAETQDEGSINDSVVDAND